MAKNSVIQSLIFQHFSREFCIKNFCCCCCYSLISFQSRNRKFELENFKIVECAKAKDQSISIVFVYKIQIMLISIVLVNKIQIMLIKFKLCLISLKVWHQIEHQYKPEFFLQCLKGLNLFSCRFKLKKKFSIIESHQFDTQVSNFTQVISIS